MLRAQKDNFAKVYAEETTFEQSGDQTTRRYLLAAEVAELLESELTAAGIEFDPINRDDTYSRYEATPPDWMQIEH